MSEAFNKYKVKISVLTKHVEKQNVDDTPVGLHVPPFDHSPLSLTGDHQPDFCAPPRSVALNNTAWFGLRFNLIEMESHCM